MGLIHAVFVHLTKRGHDFAGDWSLLGSGTLPLRTSGLPLLLHVCDNLFLLFLFESNVLAVRVQVLGDFD